MQLFGKPPSIDATGAVGTTQGLGDILGGIFAGPKAASHGRSSS